MQGSKRILVVDDDLSLRSSTRLILRHRGYDVTVARDGNQALDLAQKIPFALILMDIRMPGMSGVEVFERLEGKGHGAKVLFMSAYAMNDDVVRALSAGAIDVLRKPVDVEELLRLVEKHCESGTEVST